MSPLLPNSYKKGIAIKKGNNSLKHGVIKTIIKLEEDIMVLNNVTKFHLFCLFDLIFYVHSTIFQLCGTSLPGLNQYLARINVSCSRTTMQ